jgi:hypothetical protein
VQLQASAHGWLWPDAALAAFLCDVRCLGMSGRDANFVVGRSLTPSGRALRLVNYLVGRDEQRRPHLDPKGLRGSPVENHLKSRGPLDWQIGRLFPLENAAQVDQLQDDIRQRCPPRSS